MNKQHQPEPGPQSGDETVQKLEGMWSNIAAILMHKLGLPHIAISPEDVQSFQALGLTIVVREGEGGDGLLHIRLMGSEEAARLKAEDVLLRTSRGLRP